jgi:hypothetical protein
LCVETLKAGQKGLARREDFDWLAAKNTLDDDVFLFSDRVVKFLTSF